VADITGTQGTNGQILVQAAQWLADSIGQSTGAKLPVLGKTLRTNGRRTAARNTNPRAFLGLCRKRALLPQLGLTDDLVG
jgi:hypothetical protein